MAQTPKRPSPAASPAVTNERTIDHALPVTAEPIAEIDTDRTSTAVPEAEYDDKVRYDYNLTVFANCDNVGEFDLSLREYLTLRRHLAAMRGYATCTEEDLLSKVGGKSASNNLSFDDDLQQLAHQVQIARGIYELYPDAVTAVDEWWDEHLENLAEENL